MEYLDNCVTAAVNSVIHAHKLLALKDCCKSRKQTVIMRQSMFLSN